MKKNIIRSAIGRAVSTLVGTLLLSSAVVCQTEIGRGSGTGHGTRQAPPSVYRDAYYLTYDGLPPISVIDENNRLSEISDDRIVNDAQGIVYEPGVDQGSIVLSITHTYTIRFKADSEPFEMKIVRGIGSGGIGSQTPRQQVVFNDVSLKKGTDVKLIISPKGVSDLFYDADHNGTFESSQRGIRSGGVDVVDTNPPRLTINAVRSGNHTIVSIFATDDRSGVKHIVYSLDDKHFKTYSDSFEVDTSLTPVTVTAFADDNAGNRSGTCTRTIPRYALFR